MRGKHKAITATEARQSLKALEVLSGRISGKQEPHEADIQAQLFEWAKLSEGKYPELKLMYHIANGGKRDAVTGYHLKMQGVKKGVPDICLPVPRGRYHALFIELKAAKGRIQPSQQEWLDELNKQGYNAIVCYGFDEACTAIEEYLKLSRLINEL